MTQSGGLWHVAGRKRRGVDPVGGFPGVAEQEVIATPIDCDVCLTDTCQQRQAPIAERSRLETLANLIGA